jgi:4-amino-4-deoxy-L-arabinose transferase-like glycosyltransferase
LIDPADSIDNAITFLTISRFVSFLLTGSVLLGIVWVGTLWSDLRSGLLAAFVASCIPVFLRKTLEFRPDVAALLFWTLTIGLAIQSFKHEKPRITLFAAGLSFGAALMFTQKMLFAIPGTAVGFLVWAVGANTAVARKQRLISCGLFFLGVLIPCVATWLGFAIIGSSHEFIEKNFLLNAHWKMKAPVLASLGPFFIETWVILLLALGGMILKQSSTHLDKFSIIDLQLIFMLIGLLAGLWIIPIARQQYFLMFVPLVALFASRCVLNFTCNLPTKLQPVILYGSIFGFLLLPISEFRASLKVRNQKQLAALKFVMENSSKSDLVMDGWRGMGVFRPHAFYYYFLHPEIRAMLPKDDLNEFLDGLEAGRIRPKLIVIDSNIQQLSPRFVRYVDDHYTYNVTNGISIRTRD